METKKKSTSHPVLRVEHVTKRFGNTVALDKASFELNRGEVHALVGENGAGKSTLIKILTGLYRCDAGQILIEGKQAQIYSVADAHALGIAVIYQDFDLVPNLSVTDNLFLGQEPERFPGLVNTRKRRRTAIGYLRSVGLEREPETLAGDLSVAQRQLVALAKAVARNAHILVMDEPTSALAPDETSKLLELVRQLKSRGVSIIFVSHKLDEVLRVSDRITVFRDGRTVGTVATASSSVDELISMMVGRDMQTLYPTPRSQPGANLLEVRGFHGDSGFHDISFTLLQGEVLGIYGLKGAGRTALLRGLFGLDHVLSGELLLDGQTVHIHSPADAIMRGLALVPEDRKNQSLFPNMSTMENLSVIALDGLSRHGFVHRDKERVRCNEFIRLLKIRVSGLKQPVSELSGGNQQKVILARWLCREPRVLMLDEPTAGIDVGARFEIYQVIDELVGRGVGIILVTSELPELLGISHRVLVMVDGVLVAQFSRGAASEERIMHAIQTA